MSDTPAQAAPAAARTAPEPATGSIARAYPNIALIKYWGKRDESLILPVAGSMSLTLDAFPTTTEVTLLGAARETADRGQAGEAAATSAPADTFEMNGRAQAGKPFDRVAAFLDHVRELAAAADLPTATRRAAVRSHNEAPTGAGLASSAAGFAALALAASHAYGLDLDQGALSRLARRGSGSACRSIVAATAVWHVGDDDVTSFARPLPAPDMRLVIVTINAGPKPISSRAAMRATRDTSPYYPAWITSTEESLAAMEDACTARDFDRIGQLTETNAMRMHAAIQACDPPIRYLQPASYAVFDTCARLRETGVQAWGTADAGPNVAILTTPDDAPTVADAVAGLGDVRVVGPGPGATLVGAVSLQDALDTHAAYAQADTPEGGV